MIEYYYTIMGRETGKETWYSASGTIFAKNIQIATSLVTNKFSNVERIFINEYKNFKYSALTMHELSDLLIEKGL